MIVSGQYATLTLALYNINHRVDSLVFQGPELIGKEREKREGLGVKMR